MVLFFVVVVCPVVVARYGNDQCWLWWEAATKGFWQFVRTEAFRRRSLHSAAPRRSAPLIAGSVHHRSRLLDADSNDSLGEQRDYLNPDPEDAHELPVESQSAGGHEVEAVDERADRVEGVLVICLRLAQPPREPPVKAGERTEKIADGRSQKYENVRRRRRRRRREDPGDLRPETYADDAGDRRPGEQDAGSGRRLRRRGAISVDHLDGVEPAPDAEDVVRRQEIDLSGDVVARGHHEDDVGDERPVDPVDARRRQRHRASDALVDEALGEEAEGDERRRLTQRPRRDRQQEQSDGAQRSDHAAPSFHLVVVVVRTNRQAAEDFYSVLRPSI